MKTVVFDFDGTLSYEDSMATLFNREMHGWRAIYRLYYYLLKILSRLQIVTVKCEKEQMIKILFNSNLSSFKSACKCLAKQFRLNPIFSKVGSYVLSGDRVIVMSASSIYFLEEIFKGNNVELIGMTFNVSGGKIIGIKKHPFYKEKVKCLKELGIEEIDEMFYDSHWDECLIPMCKVYYKIKSGQIISEQV
jgi:2-hydroxy-3-keto-5-methylthiopentenyl-1-phosphate phosphatase